MTSTEDTPQPSTVDGEHAEELPLHPAPAGGQATAIPSGDPLRILLVEDRLDDAVILQRVFQKSGNIRSELKHVQRLDDALVALRAETYDAVLLDLMLPDSSGLDTLVAINGQASRVAIVVLSGVDDEALAISALQRGAQDYLVKGQVGRDLLMRTIRHAIERQQIEDRLQQQVERMESIYRLSDATSRAMSIDEIYEVALDVLVHGLKASRASVLLYDAGGVMRYKAWRGLSDGYRNLTEGHSPWSRDAADPQPVLVEDVAGDPSLHDLRDVIMGEGIRALGFIPLVYQGSLLGKFMIYYDTPHLFTAEETQMAQTIASHIAFALVRKQSDDRIRFQAQLLDQVETAVIASDLEGAVTYWNGHAERLYGWGRDEAMGRNIGYLTAPPQSAELGLAIMEQVVTEGAWEGEFVACNKAGDTFPVYVIDTLIRDNVGAPVGVICASVGITERKRIEEERARLLVEVDRQRERLDSLITSVPGIVWEAWGKPDEAGQRIDFVSHYVETMLGYSVEEWLSTPNFWLTIVHPDDKEEAARVAAEHFVGGVGGTNRFRWIARDGRVVWCEAQDMIIKDEQGNPAGMRGLTMDISERHALEQQKDEFIALASHELKTPVTAIKGYAQAGLRLAGMSEEGVADPESRQGATLLRMLKVINDQADRLTRLINDLLAVSYGQGATLTFHRESFDMRDLVREATSGLEMTHPDFTIALDLPGNAMSVHADRQRLEQVLHNLVQNAIKYSHHSHRVEISVRQGVEDPGSGVELNPSPAPEVITAVRDFGMGIPSGQHEQVFERFFRGSNVSPMRHAGLGLGLFISREIVSRHGGRMWLHSTEGQGSTFYFSLPLAES